MVYSEFASVLGLFACQLYHKNGKVIRAVGKPFCFEIDDSKIKKESVAKKQTDSKKD